jgi:acyl-coenzyme A thioesterase PaaI-like protein
MTGSEAGTRVLGHYPSCFGCGAANQQGLRLEVLWDGAEATAVLVPEQHYEGAPGVVHGGYLSTVADEVMALVATEVAGEPAMTKRLELDMRTPVFTGRPLRVRSSVTERSGTRLTLGFEAFGERDRLCYSATAVFVTIPMKRWVRAIQAQGRGPESVDWQGASASNFFRWQMAGGLDAVFQPQAMDATVRVGLELADIEPRAWTIVAGPDGVVTSEGVVGPCDVSFDGGFRAWQELIHHTTALDELLASERASVAGDATALTRFVHAIDFSGA